MRKTITTVAASVLLCGSVSSAMAVGFGRLVNATTLGQSLDVTVPIHADVTEQITSACVAAEVMVGDNVLPRPVVRARLETHGDAGTHLLRVTTTVRILEPVVQVTVSVGCPARMNRQFVVFVDPPLSAFEPVATAVTEPALASPAAAAPAPPPSNLAATAGAPPEFDDAAARSGVAALTAPEPSVAPAPAPVAAARSEATSESAKPARAKASPRKRARKPSAVARARSVPRLQLERSVVESPVMAAAAAASAAADAASAEALAARAAASAAEIATQQRDAIAALQLRLDRLQADTAASNKSLAQLQDRLREAEASRSPGWLVYALGAAVVGLSLWLGLLLGRRRTAARAGTPWWNADDRPAPPAAVAASAASGGGFVSSDMAALPEAVEFPDDGTTTDPAPFASAAMPPGTQTVSPAAAVAAHRFGDTVASVGAALVAEPPTGITLSADELIDLDQQAEFFVALGQDDSAVDLLNAFLRGTGAGCPLPYLKLMDIHRRRGDREAYDAVRDRHQMRFGRSTLHWDEPPTARAIDDHAEAMSQIESVWNDPEASMRRVEAMLVRGDPAVASLDLTAWADLQFLYLLARSVREFAGPPGDTVDLLLPLAHGASTASTPQRAPAGAQADVDLELDLQPPETATASGQPNR